MPNSARDDRWGSLLLASILGLYALFALNHLEGLRWDSDEGINTAKAWLLDEGATLYEEVWADQPPGYTVLLAEVYGLAGEPGLDALRLARALTVLLSLSGLLGVAIAARELTLAAGMDQGAAWAGACAAAVLLCLAPNFFWASRAAMIGLPAFSLAALAMGLALLHLRSGRRGHLALAALALGLSLWTKLQMIYLGLPWGLALLWKHRAAFGRPMAEAPATSSRGSEVESSLGSEVERTERVERRAQKTPGAEASATQPHDTRAALLLDLAVLALGSLGPLALCLIYYDPSVFLDQVLGSYLGTRAAYPVSLPDNLEVLRTWLFSDNGGLLALALAGALGIARRPSAGGALVLAWALLAVLTALQHAPLWLKDHLEPLMLALAALAGAGFGWGADALLARRGRAIDNAAPSDRPSNRLPLGLVPALGIAAYLLTLPHVLRVDASLLQARSYHNDGELLAPGSEEFEKQQRREDEILAAAALIRRYVGPEESVVTDHQLVSIHAGRKVAARSAAFSSRAVGVGAYSDALLIESVVDSAAPLVLMWDEDIAAFEGFRAWLEQEGFGPPFELGKDRWAYLRSDRRIGTDLDPAPGPEADPEATTKAEAEGGREVARFGDLAELLGHTLRPAESGLDLSLYWSALGRSDAPLSVFAHLVGPDGEALGQHDGPPDEGRFSTQDWPLPALVVDRHRIEVEGEVPAGSALRIGLYDPASGTRVPILVDGEPAAGDALMLPIQAPLD